jgi:HAD superfamily hydrolase (TIGR01509 family)
MTPAALLVDFGGTLDADGSPWADRFLALYRQAGGEASAATFRSAFAASDDQLAQQAGIAAMDYSQTVAAQSRLLAELLPDGALLIDGSCTRQFVTEARTLATRNRAALLALRQRFRLGVISNYQGNLVPCLMELGLDDLFDAVADSATVGARKPDPRIFELVLGQLDCAADQSWMVGDSPPNDITAAAALGMRTCWIAPQSRASEASVATTRVTRFDQVPAAVA